MDTRRSYDEEEFAAWAGRALIDGAELDRRRIQLMEGGPGGRTTAARLSFGRAAIAIAGERGYGEIKVEELIERADSNRTRFYDAFTNKEACFSWAYPAALEALTERLLDICETSEDWPSGIRKALVELGSLVSDEPEIVRGLLVHPGEAGVSVAASRQAMMLRLTRAVDRVRREARFPEHPLPPLTPHFILGMIETQVLRFLVDPHGRDLEGLVADLVWMVINLYRGPGEAGAQVRALRG